MAVDDLFKYNAYLELQNRTLEIYKQPCTVFIPDNYSILGYEDTSVQAADSTGLPYSGNSWKALKTVCWIDFAIQKSVFYHFNFFPEDADQLVTAIFKVNPHVRDGCFVRTMIPGQVSIWGDMLFKVVYMKDDGMFQTLRRVHFLRPYVNKELNDLFTRRMENAEAWL